MYRAPSRLFVCGTEIPSAEGTSQGDNLAMPLFELATLPILQKLKELRKVMQVWLADDASSVGTLIDLKTWWDMIVAEGIKYGYHVNPIKSCLIIKDPSSMERAMEIFGESGIEI